MVKDSDKGNIDQEDKWLVLLDGEPVAILENPEDAEMFWFVWDVREIDGRPVPEGLWDYSADERRAFRHIETGEVDPCGFPAGNGQTESGKVMIRGPIRGRGNEQKDAADIADS